ncbi:MAG TPA: hypothetical protein VF070_47750 [Streptosporangiaceae bacterium]
MEPVSLTVFAVGVAQSVLAGVIKDSLTGERRARNKQVKDQAAGIVRNVAPDLSRADLEFVVQRVVSEMHYIVNAHPDLEWSHSGVKVLPGAKQTIAEQVGLAQDDVAQRLERLRRIVAARRNEIEVPSALAKPGPPIASALSRPPAGGAEVDVPVRKVELARDGAYWRGRLDELEASVRARQHEVDKD